MNRDTKIEKINAYRKLLDTNLKPVSKDSEVQNTVQEEFQAWVSSQLEVLMGNGSANSSSFTEEQIVILKGLADRALNRASEQKPTPALREYDPNSNGQPQQRPQQKPPQPQVRTGNQVDTRALRDAPQPKRRNNETDDAFMERLAQWEDAQEG